jgi:hypothetical protein
MNNSMKKVRIYDRLLKHHEDDDHFRDNVLSMFIQLLKFVCGGNMDLEFNYLLRWLQFSVRIPPSGKDTTQFLITGSPACGKTLFETMITRVFETKYKQPLAMRTAVTGIPVNELHLEMTRDLCDNPLLMSDYWKIVQDAACITIICNYLQFE